MSQSVTPLIQSRSATSITPTMLGQFRQTQDLSKTVDAVSLDVHTQNQNGFLNQCLCNKHSDFDKHSIKEDWVGRPHGGHDGRCAEVVHFAACVRPFEVEVLVIEAPIYTFVKSNSTKSTSLQKNRMVFPQTRKQSELRENNEPCFQQIHFSR